jgi:hypothetical protein
LLMAGSLLALSIEMESSGGQPARAVYDVRVDRTAMRREALGPLFARLRVKLSGSLDEHWRRSYDVVAAGDESFSRFILDQQGGTVSFTSRSTDDAARVELVMQRLELLLDLANLHAASEAACQGERQSA